MFGFTLDVISMVVGLVIGIAGCYIVSDLVYDLNKRTQCTNVHHLMVGYRRKPLRRKDLWKKRPAEFYVTPYGATTYVTCPQQMPCQIAHSKRCAKREKISLQQMLCQTIPQKIIFIWHETIFEKTERLCLTIKDQTV